MLTWTQVPSENKDKEIIRSLELGGFELPDMDG